MSTDPSHPPLARPIAIDPNPNRVRVVLDGRVITETSRALTLREGTYPPVQYVPRSDVAMDLLVHTDHQTHCPYKGDASYFSIRIDEKVIENAVWTYETPIPAVAGIAGYLAFYPNKVEITEEVGG